MIPPILPLILLYPIRVFLKKSDTAKERNDQDLDNTNDSFTSIVILSPSETTPENSDDETDIAPKLRRKQKNSRKPSKNSNRKLHFSASIRPSGEAKSQARSLQKLSQKKKQKAVTTKQRLVEWINRYTSTNYGMWVECSKCQKWRWCKEYEEPDNVPYLWECSMNSDKSGNSCSIPEDENPELMRIDAEFSPGSIVWAKVSSYPWWPAMVEDDPDVEEYYWTDERSDKITQYHVTFLDRRVSRAWVHVNNIRNFNGHEKLPRLNGKLTPFLPLLKSAQETALEAQAMKLSERLKRFSFAFTYKGKWSKAGKFDDDDEPDEEDSLEMKLTQTEELLQEFERLDELHMLDIDLPNKSKAPPAGTYKYFRNFLKTSKEECKDKHFQSSPVKNTDKNGMSTNQMPLQELAVRKSLPVVDITNRKEISLENSHDKYTNVSIEAGMEEAEELFDTMVKENAVPEQDKKNAVKRKNPISNLSMSEAVKDTNITESLDECTSISTTENTAEELFDAMMRENSASKLEKKKAVKRKNSIYMSEVAKDTSKFNKDTTILSIEVGMAEAEELFDSMLTKNVSKQGIGECGLPVSDADINQRVPKKKKKSKEQDENKDSSTLAVGTQKTFTMANVMKTVEEVAKNINVLGDHCFRENVMNNTGMDATRPSEIEENQCNGATDATNSKKVKKAKKKSIVGDESVDFSELKPKKSKLEGKENVEKKKKRERKTEAANGGLKKKNKASNKDEKKNITVVVNGVEFLKMNPDASKFNDVIVKDNVAATPETNDSTVDLSESCDIIESSQAEKSQYMKGIDAMKITASKDLVELTTKTEENGVVENTSAAVVEVSTKEQEKKVEEKKKHEHVTTVETTNSETKTTTKGKFQVPKKPNPSLKESSLIKNVNVLEKIAEEPENRQDVSPVKNNTISEYSEELSPINVHTFLKLMNRPEEAPLCKTKPEPLSAAIDVSEKENVGSKLKGKPKGFQPPTAKDENSENVLSPAEKKMYDDLSVEKYDTMTIPLEYILTDNTKESVHSDDSNPFDYD